MRNENPSEFDAALAANIRAKVAELKKAGDVGIGIDNLMMVVKSPSPWLKGAPVGANARWAYANRFREIAAAAKMPRGFALIGGVK